MSLPLTDIIQKFDTILQNPVTFYPQSSVSKIIEPYESSSSYLYADQLIKSRLNMLSKIKNAKEDFSVITNEKVTDIYGTFLNEIKVLGAGIAGTAFKVCLSNECNIPLVFRIGDDDGKGIQNHFMIYEELFNPWNSTIINPHMIIPIDNFKVDFSNKVYNSLKEKIEGLKKSTSIVLLEYADGGTYYSATNDINNNLDTFLNNSKSFIDKFYDTSYTKPNSLIVNYVADNMIHDLTQISFSILAIKDKYPNFEHNDLHGGNLLVRKVDTKNNDVIKYVYPNGDEIKIPNLGYQLVVNDFSLSNLNKLGKVYRNNVFYIKHLIEYKYKTMINKLYQNSNIDLDDQNFLNSIIYNIKNLNNNILEWKKNPFYKNVLDRYKDYNATTTYGFVDKFNN